MMQLQDGVSTANVEDFPRIIEVWEASVRATHHFVAESDIQLFKSLTEKALPDLNLTCVRDEAGAVVGFMAVEADDVAALFIEPSWRGHGVGRRLMTYAINTLHATTVDVNEQNEQAVGFYLRMGFEVAGRSEVDGMGKPYPLLPMRLTSPPNPLSTAQRGGKERKFR